MNRRIEGVLLVREFDTLPEGRGTVTWWCPGCSAGHTITFGGGETWSWDGDVERPTFAPSVLVNGVRNPETPEWNAAHPRCHTFVRAGRIEYLSDCEHDLAGQTVDMVPLPEKYAAFL